MDSKNCFHCGKEHTAKEEIQFDTKSFCCVGCKTVYEIFSQNDLTCYYDFQSAPGATPIEIKGKYDFLDDEKIQSKSFLRSLVCVFVRLYICSFVHFFLCSFVCLFFVLC